MIQDQSNYIFDIHHLTHFHPLLRPHQRAAFGIEVVLEKKDIALVNNLFQEKFLFVQRNQRAGVVALITQGRQGQVGWG
jgi:hypothetical protein